MNQDSPRIAVIGSGRETPTSLLTLAEELGREIATRRAVLVCGGLEGTMAAAARGARQAGGETIGILPGVDRGSANEWITVAIPTGLGHARNQQVVLSGDAVIALPGASGTMTEIGFCGIHGRPVIDLGSWRLPGMIPARTPGEAVDRALAAIRGEPQRSETANVVLRLPRDTDVDVLFAFQRDPDARRMAAFTSKATEELAGYASWWNRVCANDSVIVRTIEHEGTVVGSILSWEMEGTREVSYWIGREHWGRGIATTALTAFLELVGTRPLQAHAAADNLASIRVLEKCGFRITSRLRGFAEERDAEIDEVEMTLWQ